MTFKPMLAATLEDPATLRFPLVVSPKLDGLRCIIKSGVALSRNLKPFRNEFVQEMLGNRPWLEGLDGELIVGSPTSDNVLGRTQSGIMSTEGRPNFQFHVFDHVHEHHLPFTSRLRIADETQRDPFILIVPHVMVASLESFLQMEQQFLLQGYEGIMIRDPHAKYKFGRSTLREGALIKFKRFTDGEGIVVSIEEGVHNHNEAEVDALGRSRRSQHSANMVPNGRVGTLFVQDLKTNETVQVSPGKMTHDQRAYFLKNPTAIVGEVVKYKWFDYGVVDAPRFATFQAFRSRDDL